MIERAKIEIYNKDCFPEMKKMKDNQFDLAIIDTEYGINQGIQFNRQILSFQGLNQLFSQLKTQLSMKGEGLILKAPYTTIGSSPRAKHNRSIWGPGMLY